MGGACVPFLFLVFISGLNGATVMTEKLSKKLYSTKLFDVKQDIIGALPLRLVEQWLSSEQTYADALELLDSHKVQGYSVSSDSVGLTKLL